VAETKIEWCDFTHNAWWGCTKVSIGCDNCYAETLARRVGERNLWGTDARRRLFGLKHWEQPIAWDMKARKAGRRFRVFCNSMADVFDNHPEVTGAREQLWELIRKTPRLDWLLLTKRIGNAVQMLPEDWGNGYPNVWLGASMVNQMELNRDLVKLLATPARVRFISFEPLLDHIDIDEAWRYALADGWGMEPAKELHWAILGGESGSGARPMDLTWAYDIRSWCSHRGIAFFMKQGSQANWPKFKAFETFPIELQVREWPESAA
jgi:protein gp37